MSSRNEETRIIPVELKSAPFQAVSGLCFLASESNHKSEFGAIFTHGYTSSISSILNWGSRLADSGVDTLIFNLPGHYLGSVNEVEKFEDFTEHAHKLFEAAHSSLETQSQNKAKNLILGGHSLGALLSLKASGLPIFENYLLKIFLVGFGLNTEVKTHFFDTDFYQKTLNIRRQLVSPAIDSDKIFPWIKNEKTVLNLKNKDIVLITGKDDVVVGEGGAARLKQILETFNKVELKEPSKLSHHTPDAAASHIYNVLKKEFNWL